jgi:hypothetical protein
MANEVSDRAEQLVYAYRHATALDVEGQVPLSSERTDAARVALFDYIDLLETIAARAKTYRDRTWGGTWDEDNKAGIPLDEALGALAALDMVTRLRSFLIEAEQQELILDAVTLRFEPGRQGTGYLKAPLPADAQMPLRLRCLSAMGFSPDQPHDCWILKYPKGSSIPVHLDHAPEGQEHHRLNVILTHGTGGDLYVEGTLVPLSVRDAYVFRPDLKRHAVSEVAYGERLVFSVGTLVPKKAGAT